MMVIWCGWFRMFFPLFISFRLYICFVLTVRTWQRVLRDSSKRVVTGDNSNKCVVHQRSIVYILIHKRNQSIILRLSVCLPFDANHMWRFKYRLYSSCSRLTLNTFAHMVHVSSHSSLLLLFSGKPLYCYLLYDVSCACACHKRRQKRGLI